MSKTAMTEMTSQEEVVGVMDFTLHKLRSQLMKWKSELYSMKTYANGVIHYTKFRRLLYSLLTFEGN